jgi:hypothetical protein
MKWLILVLISFNSLSVSATLDCSVENYEALDLGKGLSLRHVANQLEGSVTMELAYVGHAWLSIGPSESGRMVISDAVIGVPEEYNEAIPNVNPGKYRMTTESYNGSGVKLLPSSHQTLKDASISLNETHTVLRFTKKLVEEGELAISRDGGGIWIYAVGRSTAYPSMHTIKGSIHNLLLNPCVEAGGGAGTVVSVPQAQAQVVSDVSDGNVRAMWIAHGVLMALAWGCVAPLAIGVALLRQVNWAKRFKIENWWLPVHRALNLVAVALTIAGFAVAVIATQGAANEGEISDHFQGKHGKIGLVVIVLLVSQIWSGFLRPPKQSARSAIQLDGLFKTDDASNLDPTDWSESTSDSDDPAVIEELPPATLHLSKISRSERKLVAWSSLDLKRFKRTNETSDCGSTKQSFSYDIEAIEAVFRDDYTPTLPGTVYVATKSWCRVGWEISHRSVGVLVLALALYNCQTGIQEQVIKYGVQDDWTHVLWYLAGIVGGTVFALTYLLR